MPEVYLLILKLKDNDPHIVGIFTTEKEAYKQFNSLPIKDMKTYSTVPVESVQLWRRSLDTLITSGFCTPLEEFSKVPRTPNGDKIAAITDLVIESYEIAKDHGFWDYPYQQDATLGESPIEVMEPNPLAIPTKLWLAAGELVEAGNIHHKFDMTDDTKRDEFIEEIADVFIRLFDLCGYVLDPGLQFHRLGEIIMAKMEKNRGRPHKHGKNY